MAADLLTISDYYAALGRDASELDADERARAQWSITAASNVIRGYCDRDLTLNTDAIQGSRSFRYYGHELLEVDDCTSVSQVSIASTPWAPVTRILDPSEWLSGPYNATIQTYIEMQTRLPFPASPEMGFKWNADRYGYRPHPSILSVTAVWGWPDIPWDIKQATIWVIGEIEASYLPYNQEAIENYSRTVQPRSAAGTAPPGAISVRAASLLDPYARINV